MGETLYSNQHTPNPRSALDVLAFVLAPVRAFASDPDELEAIAELLGNAKSEAVKRWYSLQAEATAS
jgi:hypothetical protein